MMSMLIYKKNEKPILDIVKAARNNSSVFKILLNFCVFYAF